MGGGVQTSVHIWLVLGRGGILRSSGERLGVPSEEGEEEYCHSVCRGLVVVGEKRFELVLESALWGILGRDSR